jgi:peptidoglycan/xylan/chitin deacetylase (PgdA/CDA1 family)
MAETSGIRPVTLVLHKLLKSFTYGVTNFTPERFENLLKFLRTQGWQFSSPEYGLRAEEGRGVVVSFDDGYAHLAEVLPALMERYSFRPIVFMPTGLLGRSNRWDYSHFLRSVPHLDRDQVQNLAAQGVVFGSHGATHGDLTLCPASKLKQELLDSRKVLQDLTGQEVELLSYPFGRYDQRVAEAMQEAGYRYGFTMRLPQTDDQPCLIGRVPIYAFDTPWSINRKLKQGSVNALERFKTDTVNRLSAGTIWLNRLRRLRS